MAPLSPLRRAMKTITIAEWQKMQKFQSPRCRGTSSGEPSDTDWDDLTEVSIPSLSGHFVGQGETMLGSYRGEVSIPSLSGHFVGHVSRSCGTRCRTGRFNPLVVGALRRAKNWLFISGRSKWDVSIPSLSGHFVGLGHFPARQTNRTVRVSIPSLSGHFVGRLASDIEDPSA